MLLMKVGKPNHLESFRNGIIHFNPLSYFREDGTVFRGDEMEGKYTIDISKGFFIDGIDTTKFGSGRATLTYADSDSTLIFCAAVLDDGNSKPVPPNTINLFDEFSAEMKKFGQHAVVFELESFVKSINMALKNKGVNAAWGKVSYCDKDNHRDVREFILESKERLGDASIYFLKGEDYRAQNEWRYIIDYIATGNGICLNQNGSLDLIVPPFPVSKIIDLYAAKEIAD